MVRICMPHWSRVISARDVTFDETKRYQPDDNFDLVTEERVQPLEIKSLEGIEDKANVELPMRTLDLGADGPTGPPPERSIDTPNDTIIVDSGAGIDHGINTQLPSPEATPEATPEPQQSLAREPGSPLSTPTDSNATQTDLDKSDGSEIPTTGPNKGMDKNLILP